MPKFTNHRCVMRSRRGFTLLEVLIALTITLILMALVMEMFSKVSDGINSSRANMDLNDQVRNAKQRLISDLRGTTAPTIPPLDPTMHLGYFEYVEGPRVASSQYALGSVGGDVGENLGGNWYRDPPTQGSAANFAANSIIGDCDDILMFTTCSYDDKFVGRGGVKSGVNLSVKSRHAEIAWFLRRKTPAEVQSARADSRPEFYTLHRRQFNVLPNATIWGTLDNSNTDLSLRAEGGDFDNIAVPMNLTTGRTALDPRGFRNSLGDLTKRENRSLHQPHLWPYQMLYTSPNFVLGDKPKSGQGTDANSHSGWNPALLVASATNAVDRARSLYAWDVPTGVLSLPTLAEHSHSTFPAPHVQKVVSTGVYGPKQNFTSTAPPGYVGGVKFQQAGTRQGSDIMLTNVVGFDVKAWDPGAPVFRASASTQNPNNAGVLVPGDGGYAQAVNRFNASPTTVDRQPVAFGAFADLNYMGVDQNDATVRYRAYQETGTSTLSAIRRMEQGAPFSNRCYLPRAQFAHPGEGPLSATPTHQFARPAVWDTWSTHYEYDGIDNDYDGLIDEFTNGVDDNGNGLVDEPDSTRSGGFQLGEQEASPPYRSPLRGIKVTIRVMEQDSKQVREITVVHEFLPL